MLQTYDERNKDLIVNINGALVHRDQAAISPFDSAVQGGDAVWEGLRLYEGRVFRLDAHLARLRASAKALGFAQMPSDAEIRKQLQRTFDANKMTDGVHVRLTVTRGIKYTSGMDPRLNTKGPTLIILAEFKPPVYGDKGISLVTSSVRRPGPDVLDPKIHHANLVGSILAKIEANNAGADDAIMLDSRGFVAETNATNLFLVENQVVKTPRAVACPEGVTRDTVLKICATENILAVETDLSLAEFYRADEVFCTGTMGEIVPVTRIDGRAIAAGAAGPVTGRVAKAFAVTVRSQGELVGRKSRR